jgi:hypothetical protein
MRKPRVFALCALLCLALAVPSFAAAAPAEGDGASETAQEEARLPAPAAPQQGLFTETVLREQAEALDLDGVRDSLPKEAEKYMVLCARRTASAGRTAFCKSCGTARWRCWAISLRKPRAAPPPC